jgi:hypothetical protein
VQSAAPDGIPRDRGGPSAHFPNAGFPGAPDVLVAMNWGRALQRGPFFVAKQV